MKDGKIESYKEMLACLSARICCRPPCVECPMNRNKNGEFVDGMNCSENKRRVDDALKKWLKEKFGLETDNESPRGFFNRIMASDIEEAYGGLFGEFGGLPLPQKRDSEDAKEWEIPKVCTGTCKTCSRSETHSSGIRWCKSFGNFVHEDGFCYRYESGKLDDKEPVDK